MVSDFEKAGISCLFQNLFGTIGRHKTGLSCLLPDSALHAGWESPSHTSLSDGNKSLRRAEHERKLIFFAGKIIPCEAGQFFLCRKMNTINNFSAWNLMQSLRRNNQTRMELWKQSSKHPQSKLTPTGAPSPSSRIRMPGRPP
jgi:hypothetical protein